ncbi:MAG: hypothetical protein CMK59_09775 [Proteobacteria bacterium]|nr:hypothetical protein [Pseudomonadota bacterium]|tara:strand:- start:225 stop:1043 length:819 start_codon:yes stop_codon:yes gene_type:complete
MIPNFSSHWDQPSTEIQSNYLICSAPRTGSNLISFTLAQQGLGVPLEYCNFINNPILIQFCARILNLPENAGVSIKSMPELVCFRKRYFEQVMNKRTTPNGVFGMKIFLHHFEFFFPNLYLSQLERLFPKPVKYIHLIRKDLYKMAVSFVFANKKQAWHSEFKKKEIEIAYDFNELLEALKTLHFLQKHWSTFLKGKSPEQIYTLTYSRLVDDFEDVVKEINVFLGFEDMSVPRPPIQSQSSELKKEFAQRFKNDCKQKASWVEQIVKDQMV